MKSTVNTILVFVLGLWLSNSAASAQQIQSMKLLTAQTGWAQSESHLYWTSDGGAHWKDIAPSMSSNLKEFIGGIFFLDTSTGWVLLSYANDNGEQQFRLASTSDAGATWSSSPIKLPWKRHADDFDGGADVFFLDELHGWVNLQLSHGLTPPGAHLLATQDGGKSWNTTKGEPGWAGTSMCFFNETDGVLAGGGTDRTELWLTHDASKIWQRLKLKVPPDAAPADLPAYGEPICKDARRGFLPVTFSGGDGSPSALVLFATDDGGRSWRADRVLSNLDETSFGGKVPAAVVDSVLIAATWSRGKVTLATTAPSGDVRRTTLLGPFKDVRDLNFADSLHGWVTTSNGMFSTGDGGASWTDITPPSGHAYPPLPALPQGKPVRPNSGLRRPALPATNAAGGARSNAVTGSLTEVHLGFDKGNAPSAAKMQTWWEYSPYYDYQISLPGAANHPTNANLTPKWVSKVENQGWGLWPVWVGPQAPCANNQNLVLMTANTPAQAYTEGQTEAANAITALQLLGGNLGNTIIYYDMENYDTSKAQSNAGCIAIVENFLNGWINGMHSNPTGYYRAGVYGNVAPAARNFSQLSPLPDDVWISLASGATTPPSVTIWNLASAHVTLCDIYSNPPCPNLWPTDQRIHQYIVDGAHKITYTETWGGVTLEIDPDIIDADVAYPSTGTKIYTYNYDTFTPTGNWYNAAYSINNIGASGTYGGFINGSASDAGGEVGQTLVLDESLFPGDGVSGWGYSILDWGTSLDITPPAYTQSLGFCFGTGRVYYCTQMLGMNNAGWIAGYWNDYNSLNHGFLNQGGTLSSFDAPGAAGGIGTFATAINDAGLVVGYYYDSNYDTHGFLYNANTQQFIAAPLDYPGGSYTQLNGINGDAQIVGEYYDGANYQGFLYSNGTFTSTSGPCGPETVPLGINNNGQMVGNGFVSYDGGLSCSPFDDPAAGGGETVPYSINDAGQISGTFYSTATSMYDAFVAVPQTP